MRILAIETSCDETAVSALEITGPAERPEIKLLANSLLSQIELHKEYGGVYPNLAKREHQKNLPVLMENTLKEAGLNLDKPEIDCIAVTAGPGLEPALWVGITFAEDLSKKWSKPILPINHMEGHIYSVLYQNGNDQGPMTNAKLKMPALALLVSGGHTELIYMRDFCRYEILGKTRDDAVGEAFDKVARVLGLPYPGGPAISAMTEIARKRKVEGPRFNFPIPMLNSGDLDFSYSGLKTAVLYKVKNLGRELTEDEKDEIACAFEDAAVGELIKKTRKALEERPAPTLIIGGGVSANRYLRSEIEKLKESYPQLDILMPSLEVTGDNSIMIALAAYERVLAYPDLLKEFPELIARGNLRLS